MRQTVVLFGEAEKGKFRTAHFCRDLDQLEGLFGHPPDHSKGLFFAIQALMYQHLLVFFRVEEEGYSAPDYLFGFETIKQEFQDTNLSAIGLPGVGDSEIIDAGLPLCSEHKSLLLFTESDLYDYLTSSS